MRLRLLRRRRVVGLKTRLAVAPAQSRASGDLEDTVRGGGGGGGGSGGPAVCKRCAREVEERRLTEGENRGLRQKENKP